jgi:hypothetical protein
MACSTIVALFFASWKCNGRLRSTMKPMTSRPSPGALGFPSSSNDSRASTSKTPHWRLPSASAGGSSSSVWRDAGRCPMD